jgi:hypothetical protein
VKTLSFHVEICGKLSTATLKVLYEQSKVPICRHPPSVDVPSVEFTGSLLSSRARLVLYASFLAFSIAFTRKSFCSSRCSLPLTTSDDHSGSPLPGWMHVSILRGAWSDSVGKLPGGLFSSLTKSTTLQATTRGKRVIIRGRVLEIASKSASSRPREDAAGSNCGGPPFFSVFAL